MRACSVCGKSAISNRTKNRRLHEQPQPTLANAAAGIKASNKDPCRPATESIRCIADKFRWRLRASNEEEIASGQGYESKEGCMKGVESVKTNASKTKIVDMTK